MEIQSTYIELFPDRVTFRTPFGPHGIRVVTFSFTLPTQTVSVLLETISSEKPTSITIKELNELLQLAKVIKERGYVEK